MVRDQTWVFGDYNTTKRILETIGIISLMVSEETHIALMGTVVLLGAIVMRFLSQELMLDKGRVQLIGLRFKRLGKLSINFIFIPFYIDVLLLVYFTNLMDQEETPT